MIAVPATATGDTATAIAGCPYRAIRRRPVVVAMPTILDPFPDIAVHVVETERIGGERADRGGLSTVPLAAAAVAVGVAFADLLAPGIGLGAAGTRRILPFRL